MLELRQAAQSQGSLGLPHAPSEHGPTLPIWMLEELVRPRQRPVTNVVAMVVVLVTFLPILAAYYLTRDGDQIAGSGK